MIIPSGVHVGWMIYPQKWWLNGIFMEYLRGNITNWEYNPIPPMLNISIVPPKICVDPLLNLSSGGVYY
jgi:hypothetical protein